MKRFFFVSLFAALVALILSAAAFADPHIKIEISSLYASGNQMSITMDFINDGDTDCRLTKLTMQSLKMWDDMANMDVNFIISDMNILVEAQDFVTKSYNIPLRNYVDHEFMEPEYKFHYNVEWTVERSSDDDDNGYSDDDGDDDTF